MDEEKTRLREIQPFYDIKEMYPRYLFVADLVLQKNIEGIKVVNIAHFIANNERL